MDKFVVEFTKDKDTPGTRRFAEKTEVGVRGHVGSIYLLKKSLEAHFGKLPEGIRITIEATD